MERLIRSERDYDGVRLHIDETGGLTLAALALRARRRKSLYKTVCLVIDYLQIMGGDGRREYQNRVQEITAITSGLKALAKALEIPIIALSQLSRQVEARDDKRPQLSDLRDSGSIEQDADIVLFVFREDYYLARREPPLSKPDLRVEWEAELEAVRGLAEIIIAKYRHGPIGTVKLAFSASLTRLNRPSIWSWRNAIRKSELPPLAKLCCYVLADYMTGAEKGCFPSIVTLMKDTGLSNTSIAKHIRLAIEAGLLVRHRFRDRAGHCAGTNYYPRFPAGHDAGSEEEPAGPGAGTFFDLPEAAHDVGVAPVPAPSRRSPWANFPDPKILNEPSIPDEPQSVPALTPLTHNLPVEPSNRKLLQQPQDEFRQSSADERTKSAPAEGEKGLGRDETEIAFVAWVETAKKLAIPAYASQLTVARRSLLRQTLSSAGGLQAWRAILARLPRARFLLGQGKRGFWISFEALCSETIRVRLLEGAYDHVPSAAAPARPAAAVQVPVARWSDRIRTWVSSGKAAPEAWPASWGPPPGAPGCIVPEECLAGLQA